MPQYGSDVDLGKLEECSFTTSYSINVEQGEIFDQWFRLDGEWFVVEVPPEATAA